MIALNLRLAFSGLRSRGLQSFLTLVMLTITAGALTLGQQVSHLSDDSWTRTFDFTNGAHLIVITQGNQPGLARLGSVEGVTEANQPQGLVFTTLMVGGQEYSLRALEYLEGQPVERPLITDGIGARPGGILLERSFARTLGIKPGDEVAVATSTGPTTLRVDGLFLSSLQEEYPDNQPGLGLVRPEMMQRIQPDEAKRFTIVPLRLSKPGLLSQAARRIQASVGGPVRFNDWQGPRDAATQDNVTMGIIFNTFTVLIMAVAVFVIGTLISGRLLAQQREMGLLRAVGFTSAQVSRLFLIEQLTIAAAAIAIGFIAGTLLAPEVLRPTPNLLGAGPSYPQLSTLAITGGAITSLVTLATLLSVLRGSRLPVAQTMGGQGNGLNTGLAPGLIRSLTRRGLPFVLVTGLRDLTARKQRALFTTLGILITVAALVAGLIMEARFKAEDRASAAFADRVFPGEISRPPAFSLAPTRPDPVAEANLERERFRSVVHGLNAGLVLLAVANLLATTILSVRERVRDFGILRAVGVTPGQVTLSVVSAGWLLSAVAALLGIPAGILLWRVVYGLAEGGEGTGTMPDWGLTAAAVFAVTLVTGATCALAARGATRVKVTDALRFE